MEKKRLLYLGYVGFKNLGDEICYQAFLQWANPLEPWLDVMCYDLHNRRTITGIHSETPLAGVMIGGGSLFQGTAFVEPALEAAKMGLPLWSFGTGIDYFTEAYLQRLMDKTLPVDSPLMFDGKDLKEDALRTILNKCRFAGVRGPLTQRYFSCLTGKGTVNIIGDPGLIYMPCADNTIAADHPALGERYVALNWGKAFGSLFGFNEQRTMMDVVDGIRRLILGGYKIFIYPMCPGDLKPCQRIYHAIGHPDACELASGVYPINAICTMLKHASLSICFKLHSSVMSARMGTPFISLAYRSKCVDFALSVGMQARCVSTASPNIGKNVAEFEAGLQQNRQAIIKTLFTYRSAYKKHYEELLDVVKSDMTN